jgi:hypothetical protein
VDDQTDDQARQACSTDLIGENKGLVSGALSAENMHCRAFGAMLERQPRRDGRDAHGRTRMVPTGRLEALCRQLELLALACVHVAA